MATTDIQPINETIRSSFPPLDPNGLPFSIVLRGSIAELGELRSLLLDASTRELLTQRSPIVDELDIYDDVAEECDQVEGVEENERSSVNVDNTAVGGGAHNFAKRRREDADAAVDEAESYSGSDVAEDLLLFLPAIQCTCSSWDMTNVQGDLVITSIRVLFIASTGNAESSENCNDIAIDGRCIALHAVDSVSTSDQEDHNSLPHVYCQLSDPGSESNDIGFSTAFGMGASANIMDDNEGDLDNDEDEDEEEINEDNGVIEVYFKPIFHQGLADRETHKNVCQRLFDALTKLANLNPADESDDGCAGGLLNMLSLMTGMGEHRLDGYVDGNDNDDMVIRLGGSNNNFVEDDDSEGVPENERQIMLERLDNLLVVPPQYEIPSEEDDGQFDDADEDDNELL
jgi:hypothetical protein